MTDITLNEQQQAVFDAWKSTTDNIFCTGHGGVGKSRLLEAIVNSIESIPQSKRPKVAVTAPTGTAAFNINGTTIHKFAGIGIDTENLGNMIERASKPSSLRVWREVNVLIIDEISMISGILFSNLDHVGQATRNSTKPFGGIRLLVFGDFLQLPPVTAYGIRAYRAFECNSWRKCNMSKFILTQTVRQTDVQFVKILDSIRLGKCNKNIIRYMKGLSREVEYEDGIEPVRLFALNNPVKLFNKQRLDSIDSDIHTFIAKDSSQNSIGRKSLDQCPVPAVIELKQGAKVMLVRNLTKDLVNGSVGIVKGYTTVNEVEYPIVSMIGRSGTIEDITISYIPWETRGADGSVIATRIQIPLILAWALTMHKSQGKTIPRVFVDMAGVFESGQAYTALSRVQSPDNLQVINFSPDYIKTDAASVEFYKHLNKPPVVEVGKVVPAAPSSSNTILNWLAQNDAATDVARSTEAKWEPLTANVAHMLKDLSISSTHEMPKPSQ